MRGTTRSLFAALILIALSASLPGCAYQRPDELTFGEVWRFKNLVISGSPDLASRLMQHTEFTYDNVVRLKEGASPDEVRAVFGHRPLQSFQEYIDASVMARGESSPRRLETGDQGTNPGGCHAGR